MSIITLQAQQGRGAFQWADAGLSQMNGRCADVVADSNKNIYILGFTRNTPSYNGMVIPLTQQDQGFLVKLDSARNIVWSKSVPSTSVGRLEKDDEGNIYVADAFRFAPPNISVDIDTITIDMYNPSISPYSGFINYLAKFNSSGDVLWVKEGGHYPVTSSNFYLNGRHQRPDLTYQNGSIYYLAPYLQLDTTTSPPYIVAPPLHYSHFGGQLLTPFIPPPNSSNYPTSAFLTRVDTDGNLIWKKDFTFSGNQAQPFTVLGLGGVGVDDAGHVYAQVTNSTNHAFDGLPLTVQYGSPISPSTNLSIIKSDTAGNTITQAGFIISSGANHIHRIKSALTVTDSNLFVFANNDLSVQYTPGLAVQGDFIMKLNSQLQPVAEHTLYSAMVSNGILVNELSNTSDGDIIATGSSANGLTAPGNISLQNSNDAFALKINQNLTSTYILRTPQSPLNSSGWGITEYYDGSVLMCGQSFYNTYFDSTFFPDPLTRFFLTKIIPCDSLNTLAQSTATVICSGDSALLFDAGDTTLTKYRWFHNNTELPSKGEHELKVGSGGDYFFVADSLGCRDTSDVISIQVTPTPQVTVQPSAITVCDDAPPFTLTGGQPTGGHWTGNGVLQDSIFDASLTGQGNYTIYYHYIDSAGCSDSAMRNVIVSAAQAPTVLPVSNACLSDTAVNLASSVFPGGGTFSGTAVASAGVFNPSAAGLGTHTFTYTYTNSSGCSASSTGNITVNPLPQVSLAPLSDACSHIISVPLTGGTPQGGSWAGNGVSGNNFFPPAAGIGSHTITYSVSQNGCTATAARSIEVIPKSTGKIDSVSNVCRNDTGIILSAAPSGGYFYGLGIQQDSIFNPNLTGAGMSNVYYVYQNACGTDTVGDSIHVTNEMYSPQIDSLPQHFCIYDTAVQLSASPGGGSFWGSGVNNAFFDPGTSGVGSDQIYYSITDSNGCMGYDSITINVQPKPQTTFTPGDTVCFQSPLVDLSQFSSPPGGQFSGIPVTGSDFDPSATPGLYHVYHNYTDSFGCVAADTAQVEIFETPTPQWSAPGALCENSGSYTPVNYNPAGGVFSGAGISNNQFNPQGAGPGSHAITYTYSTVCGAKSITDSILVSPPPIVTLDTFSDICQNHGLLNLSGGIPQGGVFSGTQVSGGQFDPAQGTGSYDIIYTFTDSNNCTSADTQSITVYNTPNPVWNPVIDSFCANQSTVTLTQGNPATGTFSGPGVTGNSFNPSATGAGTFSVIYTISTSCGLRHDSAVFTVNSAPSSSLLSDSLTCTNSPPLTLQGQPQGGVFSGTAVSGNTFDPSLSGQGNYLIHYIYTDSNQCSDSSTQNITVVPNPVAQFNLPDSVCDNTDSLNLGISASPPGGIFNGAGVFNAIFYPDSVNTGSHQIQYYVQDQFGCADTTSKTVFIAASPTLSVLPGNTICSGDSLISLHRVSPAGGVYSGAYVSNGLFNPQAAGLGLHNIDYVYHDSNNCSSQISFTLEVNPLPEVTAGNIPALCLNDSAIVLDTVASSPSGGFYTTTDSILSRINPADYIPGVHEIHYSFTDSAGCTGYDTGSFEILSLPEVTFNLLDSVCDNFPAIELNDVVPQGGEFSGPGVVNDKLLPELLSPGFHSVYYTFTDSNGCKNSDTSSFTLLKVPEIYLPDTSVCFGETITLFGSDHGVNYWSTGDTTNKVEILGDQEGIYRVTSLTYQKCTVTEQATISRLKTPSPELPEKITICDDEVRALQTLDSHFQYMWSTNETNRSIDVNGAFLTIGTHTYKVTVTNENNCKGSASAEVEVINCDTLGDFRLKIYPNPSTLNYFNMELYWPGKIDVKGTLISANGQLVRVLNFNLPEYPETFTVYTYGIAAGKYLLVLESNDEIKTTEILIAN